MHSEWLVLLLSENAQKKNNNNKKQTPEMRQINHFLCEMLCELVIIFRVGV